MCERNHAGSNCGGGSATRSTTRAADVPGVSCRAVCSGFRGCPCPEFRGVGSPYNDQSGREELLDHIRSSWRPVPGVAQKARAIVVWTPFQVTASEVFEQKGHASKRAIRKLPDGLRAGPIEMLMDDRVERGI